MGEIDLLNDFFLYNIFSNSWTELIPDNYPVARQGACITTYNNFIIIQGGQTVSDNIDDLIFYDVLNNTLYTAIRDEKNHPNLNIKNHKCWTRTVGTQLQIIIATGEYNNSKPLTSVYIGNLNITPGEVHVDWHESYSDLTGALGWANAGVVQMQDWFFIIGGSKWDLTVSSMITLAYIDENINFQFNYSNSSTYWYKHGFIHYQNAIYTGFSAAFFSNMVANLYLLSDMYRIVPEKLELPYILCSMGTYGSECMPCPQGTYTGSLGSNECLKCPAGSYGLFHAATSIYMCFPCPYGSFGPGEGLIYCYQCAPDFFCPVGSSFTTTNPFIFSATYPTQPPAYSPVLYDPFNGNVYYIVYFSGIFILILYFLMPSMGKKIAKIDYFTSSHDQRLNMPIIMTKTPMGGAFTLIFIVFLLVFASQAVISYLYTNIQETKTLMPSVVLNETYITDEFVVSVEFLYYPGRCIGKSIGGCSANLYTTFFEFSGIMKCSVGSFNTCIITFTCSNCQLTSDSFIRAKLCEHGSLATALRVNVSSFSSIPGYYSAESFFVMQYDGNVFIGNTPTIFNFEVTRSV